MSTTEDAKTVLTFKHTMCLPLNDFGAWTQFARFQRPVDDATLATIAALWAENASMTFDAFYREFDDQAC